MSTVTWGLARGHGATVFCSRCRHVFGRELSLPEARELHDLHRYHKCDGPGTPETEEPAHEST